MPAHGGAITNASQRPSLPLSHKGTSHQRKTRIVFLLRSCVVVCVVGFFYDGRTRLTFCTELSYKVPFLFFSYKVPLLHTIVVQGFPSVQNCCSRFSLCTELSYKALVLYRIVVQGSRSVQNCRTRWGVFFRTRFLFSTQ